MSTIENQAVKANLNDHASQPSQTANAKLARRKLLKNAGRWNDPEHKRFLEAVVLFGSDWKRVHKCVVSRTSTQARSHAQKFLLKLKKKLKILPTFDNASKTMKLSNESVNKIVREIVDNSSMRGRQVAKEKLVKMIMGFANLLIGKSKSPNVTGSSNSGKVFNIEKIKRRNNYFLIEKTKKDSELAKTNNVRISSQDELLRFLQQERNVSSPNKNIINIISISISNKNGESLPELASLVERNTFPGDVHDNLKPAELKEAESNDYFVNNFDFNEFSESRSRLNSTSTVESPERINFFDECYEDSSSISYGFSPVKEMEEVSKFFNW